MVEPTHVKKMLVKLDHIPKNWGLKIKKTLPKPWRHLHPKLQLIPKVSYPQVTNCRLNFYWPSTNHRSFNPKHAFPEKCWPFFCPFFGGSVLGYICFNIQHTVDGNQKSVHSPVELGSWNPILSTHFLYHPNGGKRPLGFLVAINRGVSHQKPQWLISAQDAIHPLTILAVKSESLGGYFFSDGLPDFETKRLQLPWKLTWLAGISLIMLHRKYIFIHGGFSVDMWVFETCISKTRLAVLFVKCRPFRAFFGAIMLKTQQLLTSLPSLPPWESHVMFWGKKFPKSEKKEKPKHRSLRAGGSNVCHPSVTPDQLDNKSQQLKRVLWEQISQRLNSRRNTQLWDDECTLQEINISPW